MLWKFIFLLEPIGWEEGSWASFTVLSSLVVMVLVTVDERVQQLVSHTGEGLPSSDTTRGGVAVVLFSV
jgi:hypothetical protein